MLRVQHRQRFLCTSSTCGSGVPVMQLSPLQYLARGDSAVPILDCDTADDEDVLYRTTVEVNQDD